MNLTDIPYSLVTCLIGTFSGLMALTAFHAFVIVHEDKIRSGFYKEFVRFFGKGANLPILAFICVGVILAGLDCVGLLYDIRVLIAHSLLLKHSAMFILLFGWGFTILGIFLVIIKYLHEYYEITVEFNLKRKVP